MIRSSQSAGFGWPRPFALAHESGLPITGVLLRVSVARQRISVFYSRGLWREFVVSTAEKGLSNRQGSHGTPPGWHRVAAWIGDSAPLGQIFVSRRPAVGVLPGSQWRSTDHHDFIMTRILRLSGLEPGINSGAGIDSFQRFIYVHGTNHEQLLGTPASQGCIRMANHDIRDLFNFTRNHETWCWIGEKASELRRLASSRQKFLAGSKET